MSKGKGKRRDKKSKGGNAGNGAINSFWLQLARETIGNFAGQIMADKAEQCVVPASSGKGEDAEECDVAADVLRILSESAPKSIAELLQESDTTLTPLLAALQTLRDFRLIEMSGGGDEDAVRLTASGTRTASALRREQIEHDGRTQLAS